MIEKAQRSRFGAFAALTAVAVLLLSTGLAAAPVSTGGGITVKEIVIDAPAKADIGEIRNAILVREGDAYSAEAVRRDRERLVKLNNCRDAFASAELIEGGIRLVYKVVLHRRVASVRFEGDYTTPDTKLLDQLACKEGSPANPGRLRNDLETLRRFFREEGFAFSDVRQKVAETEDGDEVVYHIEAGPRVSVEQLRFEGIGDIPPDDVRKAMISIRESTVFTRGRFDPDLLRDDVRAIGNMIRARGYLNASVGYETVLDDARERLYVVIRANLGKLSRVSKLSFEGNSAIPEAELRGTMRLTEGGAYSQEQINKDMDAIRKLYGRRGYVKARAITDHTYGTTEPDVQVTVHVEEGPLAYVRNVIVRGNMVTRDNVIRRDVSLIPGNVINMDELDETKRRLTNTGLFANPEKSARDEGVTVRLADTEYPDREDVIVTVAEAGRGEIGVGASYHSEFGLMGNVRFTLRNFDALAWPTSWREVWSPYTLSGGGQTLNISLTPGYDYQDYRLSWMNPSVWDTPYSVGFDLYDRDVSWPDYYDEQRIGSSVTVGRSFFHDLQLSVTPRVERVKISNVSDGAPQEAKDSAGDYLRDSIVFSANYDRRDNRFLTTSGYRLAGDVEFVGTALGGDINMVKETFEGRRWWTVAEPEGWGKHVFTVGSRLGFIQRTRGDIPIFERFFMGGLDSLRGFAVRRAGPIDPVSGRQTGGDSVFLSSAEYEIPIVKDYVRGVTFLDMGSLADNGLQFGSLRMSVGGGVRIRIPAMGMERVPVCFYVAAPIRSRPGDESENVVFTVGTMFGF